MKKKKKILLIILVIIAILSMLGYLLYNTYNRIKNLEMFDKNFLDSTSEQEKENKKKQKEYEKKIKNNGQIVTVSINAEETKQFYILSEDETTYTLLAAEPIGTSAFYLSDECNSENESACNYTTEYIYDFLASNTASWSYVGNVRLLNMNEIVKIGNFKIENGLYTSANKDYIYNSSYWIEDNSKDDDKVHYLDKDSKKILKDKMYNQHDVTPVIVVLKAFVKND